MSETETMANSPWGCEFAVKHGELTLGREFAVTHCELTLGGKGGRRAGREFAAKHNELTLGP